MPHPTLIRILSTLCLVALLQCNTQQSVQTTQDSVPRLAIVSAFEPELTQLLAWAEISETRVIKGHTYHIGTLGGNEVVLFLSGVSMVNAAVYTQMAIDHFNVSGIVFSGIAGGVNPSLHIGDVVVPEQWAAYQEHIFARKDGDGWAPGRDSDEFGNYGMMFPRRIYIAGRNGEPDLKERRFWFPTDSTMVAVARRVADMVQLRRAIDGGDSLETRPAVVVGGNGVSGPTFVNNAAYRDWVWDTFQANALDMESAAVAHVAYVNAVPVIIFRSLSDLAGGGPGENRIETFFKLASDNSAAVVLAFLEAWAQRN